MAAASYTTDLTLIHACDAASASWTEPTGFIDGAITLPETDYFIQNNGCLSKNMGTGTSAASGAIYNYGSGASIPSGSAVLIWLFFGAPNALATQANGGLRVFVGSATTAFKQWYVRGSNTYTYGGWVCVPVDPNTTADATTGSPTATLQYFGAAAVLSGTTAVSKGNPFGIDSPRFGRCEMRINGGDLANGYATFSGFATQNDSTANRWGLFQAISGGYLWQGLMTLGYTSAVDFRDSNVNIQIANTEKVAAAFNKIEIRQASSRVDWTGVSIQALGTVAKGQFEAIDDADINFESCTFTDMSTFVFKANSTVNSTIFRRCGAVTGGGGTFTSCVFDKTTAASAIVVADLAKVSSCSFISDGSSHAVELTTAGTYTWTGTGTGFDTGTTGSPVTPTNTGNEMIYVTAMSGTITISVAAGATVPSIRRVGGSTATINVSAGAVDTFATIVDAAGSPISGAQVFIKAKDATGPLPYDDTVTITRSGTTATASLTAHGLLANDKVVISGATQSEYNGIFTVTAVTTNTFDYTVSGSPATPATGTIKCTYVAISGTTDANGKTATMSRVFSSNQPVIGWARKSSSAPYYKTGPINGTITTGGGASLSAVLIADQ